MARYDDSGIHRCPNCSTWGDVTRDWCTCRHPACHNCCANEHDLDQEPPDDAA